MIEDAVLELMKSYFGGLSKKFKITIHEYKGLTFGLTSNDSKLLLSFLLIRQREETDSVCVKLPSVFHLRILFLYAQYEKGKINFSIDQYEKLMHAINPNKTRILRVI